MRSIWRDAVIDDLPYVPRCSCCGKYKKKLKVHWFFTGLYCIACIQDVLYDNCRTVDEINNPSSYFNPKGVNYKGEVSI